MKKVLIPIIAFACIVSCNKKQDEPEPLTSLQKIASGTYRYQSITFGRPVTYLGITSDNGLLLYPCADDDQNTFNADGTTLENDNALLCGSKQIVLGSWKLINDSQMLWDGQLYDIKQNDSKTLVLFQAATSAMPSITTTMIH
jgi:hypothetical protein